MLQFVYLFSWAKEVDSWNKLSTAIRIVVTPSAVNGIDTQNSSWTLRITSSTSGVETLSNPTVYKHAIKIRLELLLKHKDRMLFNGSNFECIELLGFLFYTIQFNLHGL